jgi:hypothetical protein
MEMNSFLETCHLHLRIGFSDLWLGPKMFIDDLVIPKYLLHDSPPQYRAITINIYNDEEYNYTLPDEHFRAGEYHRALWTAAAQVGKVLAYRFKLAKEKGKNTWPSVACMRRVEFNWHGMMQELGTSMCLGSQTNEDDIEYIENTLWRTWPVLHRDEGFAWDILDGAEISMLHGVLFTMEYG